MFQKVLFTSIVLPDCLCALRECAYKRYCPGAFLGRIMYNRTIWSQIGNIDSHAASIGKCSGKTFACLIDRFD